ncbi:MAG: LysE family translocator [Verrucomicrobiota bacterium JB022]|nr:LysE family translocator [Verrucomicrobiota bacterium JB022]
MDGGTYLLFCGGSLLLIASPGPDFLYVSGRALSQGVRAGLWSALGLWLGLLVHTTAAVVGLTALLQTSALAFAVVKYAGAAYLLYLAVMAFKRGGALDFSGESPALSTGRLVRQAFLTNVLNPKVGLTFLAFMPQFIPQDGLDHTGLIGFLGFTLGTLALGWFSLVSILAAQLRAAFERFPKMKDGLRYATGSLFTVFGLRLLAFDR